jgi:hypothetical protein
MVQIWLEWIGVARCAWCHQELQELLPSRRSIREGMVNPIAHDSVAINRDLDTVLVYKRHLRPLIRRNLWLQATQDIKAMQEEGRQARTFSDARDGQRGHTVGIRSESHAGCNTFPWLWPPFAR